MKHILLLEDDISLGHGIRMALESEACTVLYCHTFHQARKYIYLQQFDLFIFDVNLPDGNGLELLRQIRANQNNTPTILLTANDLEIDEVIGLESGADDYITKPFSLAVLRARVSAQLRRNLPQNNSQISIDCFTFDFEKMDFRKEGVAIELSKTEQKLLRILIENRGHAVSRTQLVDYIWTDSAEFVEENALSVTVKRLRNKLENNPKNPEYLKTVYGIGYKWAVKV